MRQPIRNEIAFNFKFPGELRERARIAANGSMADYLRTLVERDLTLRDHLGIRYDIITELITRIPPDTIETALKDAR